MNLKYFKEWAKAALIRAVKTFAQVVVVLIGDGYFVLKEVDWLHIFSVAAVTAIVSICTSIAGLPELKVPELNEKVQELNDMIKAEDFKEDGEKHE